MSVGMLHASPQRIEPIRSPMPVRMIGLRPAMSESFEADAVARVCHHVVPSGTLPVHGAPSDPSEDTRRNQKDDAEDREPEKSLQNESKHRQNRPKNEKDHNEGNHNYHLFASSLVRSR